MSDTQQCLVVGLGILVLSLVVIGVFIWRHKKFMKEVNKEMDYWSKKGTIYD